MKRYSKTEGTNENIRNNYFQLAHSPFPSPVIDRKTVTTPTITSSKNQTIRNKNLLGSTISCIIAAAFPSTEAGPQEATTQKLRTPNANPQFAYMGIV